MKRPLRIEGDVAYIPLTKGYEAVIDVADVPVVDGRNWYALVTPHTVYARTKGLNGKTVLLHRHLTTPPEDLLLDHKDGDGLNNRRENLRLATPSQNNMNTRCKSNNTTGLKGVGYRRDRKCWVAQIRTNEKRVHLGSFLCPEEAYAAYCEAAKQLHGEFARIE